MKTTLFAALFAAVAASTTLAADVNVVGARTTTAAMPTAAMPSDAAVNVMGAQTSPMMTTAGTDLRIASKDILNRATALLNKNTLAMDNNVFIARSNVVFTQNDRLAMRKKVEDAVMRSPQEQDMTAATLTKSVLRAVSAPDTDSALMTKASGVVAAKGDPSALVARIAAFVDAVGQREMEQEQAIQSQTPSGIIVLIGTKDLLRQSTAVINKNKAASDNQVTVSRSAISPTQNDQVVLTGGAKVADAVLPAAAINVGQVTKTESAEPMYRTMIAYPKEGDADAALKDKEQWLGGFGGLGWGLGYRYPLGYWNTFGAGLYGGGCGLGFGAGGFYYC